MTRTLGLPLALALGLAALPPARAEAPFAGGFDANAVAAFTTRHGAEGPAQLADPGLRARLGQVVQAAAGLRVLASLGADKVARQLPARDAAAWRGLVEDGDTLAGQRLSYFFQGSLAEPALLASDSPIVGFYNPVVDGWVLTLWRLDADGPHLALASAVTGDSMRGAAPAQAPAWTGLGQLALADALAISHGANIAAFRQRFAAFGAGAPDLPGDELPLLNTRIDILAAGIISVSGDPAHDRALGALTGAIGAGDAAALDGLAPGGLIGPAARIAGQPQAWRGALRPVAYLKRADGGDTVLLGAPSDGGVILFADYGHGAGAPSLEHLALVSVRAAEGGISP